VENKLLKEGYDVINIGNPSKLLDDSFFYNMEKQVMNWDLIEKI
jgi:hypothetical protein